MYTLPDAVRRVQYLDPCPLLGNRPPSESKLGDQSGEKKYQTGKEWLDSTIQELQSRLYGPNTEAPENLEDRLALIKLALKKPGILREDELDILSKFLKTEEQLQYSAFIDHFKQKNNLH